MTGYSLTSLSARGTPGRSVSKLSGRVQEESRISVAIHALRPGVPRAIGVSLLLTVLLFVTSCSTVLDFRGVNLEFYNLSEKTITVVDIGGFPAMQGLHLLQPNPGSEENPAIRVEQSVQGPLLVPDKIKITWLEGGTSSGSGAPHHIEIPRDESGVPASLSGRALRFIYLGKNQWRLKVTKRDA